MKRELIRGKYHFKISNRDLNGKTASPKNPKYEISVSVKDDDYKTIGTGMSLSACHCFIINYCAEHENKNYISKSDRFYLSDCLGLSDLEINLLYKICVERDETVREIFKGFLDLL